jgi:uncharacterized integral membrane protein (TIGR00697 family)
LFGKQGLLASIVLAILLSNLQGPKLTIIFGMQTSLGVIFYSSIFFATDLLSEKYGRAEANRAVLIGFTVSVIIVLMLSLALLFQPSTQPEVADFSADIHAAFQSILDFTPRFASVVTQQPVNHGLTDDRYAALRVCRLVGRRRPADRDSTGAGKVWF